MEPVGERKLWVMGNLGNYATPETLIENAKTILTKLHVNEPLLLVTLAHWTAVVRVTRYTEVYARRQSTIFYGVNEVAKDIDTETRRCRKRARIVCKRRVPQRKPTFVLSCEADIFRAQSLRRGNPLRGAQVGRGDEQLRGKRQGRITRLPLAYHCAVHNESNEVFRPDR